MSSSCRQVIVLLFNIHFNHFITLFTLPCLFHLPLIVEVKVALPTGSKSSLISDCHWSLPVKGPSSGRSLSYKGHLCVSHSWGRNHRPFESACQLMTGIFAVVCNPSSLLKGRYHNPPYVLAGCPLHSLIIRWTISWGDDKETWGRSGCETSAYFTHETKHESL